MGVNPLHPVSISPFFGFCMPRTSVTLTDSTIKEVDSKAKEEGLTRAAQPEYQSDLRKDPTSPTKTRRGKENEMGSGSGNDYRNLFCVKIQPQTMKLLLILILSLMLVSVSSAKQESLIMGPYKVSFDLNTTQKYCINNTMPATYGETYEGISFVIYNTIISATNDSAEISVFYYAHKMDKNLDRTKSDITDSSISWSFDFDLYDRIIDGQSGVLGVGESDQLGGSVFNAIYWPAFNTTGDTKVQIMSFLPWNDGTLSLLKTIHVEMVGKPPI